MVARIAGRQHGVVSRDQLRAAGLTEAAIQQEIAAGRIYPLFRSTFAVGHPRQDRAHRLVAAVLACGDGSVISHGSAAALLGLWSFWPADVEVIAPVEAGRKIDGIRRRFVSMPCPEQITHRLGVTCTAPSRTIIDVAGIAGMKLLADTVEQAAVLEVLNVPEIDSILLEGRRRGEKKLNRILEPWRRYTPRVRLRSRMEAKMLPLLTHHNLPIPETNEKLKIGREIFEVASSGGTSGSWLKPTAADITTTRSPGPKTGTGTGCWQKPATACRGSAGTSSATNQTGRYPRSAASSSRQLFLMTVWRTKGTADFRRRLVTCSF